MTFSKITGHRVSILLHHNSATSDNSTSPEQVLLYLTHGPTPIATIKNNAPPVIILPHMIIFHVLKQWKSFRIAMTSSPTLWRNMFLPTHPLTLFPSQETNWQNNT